MIAFLSFLAGVVVGVVGLCVVLLIMADRDD